MLNCPRYTAAPATTEAERRAALDVLRATYKTEKRWVADEAALFPPEDLDDERVLWAVAYVEGEAAGVLRVLYDPPLHLYKEYGLQTLDHNVDIDAFIRAHRIAEIGRFAVMPECRRSTRVVSMLMRVASEDTLRRGYTHYVTDIFEGDAHSPYNFHTRVIGFQPVAVHETGEMNASNRRVTLVLDLKAAYNRLRQTKNRMYRLLTAGWDEALHRQLSV